VIKSGLAVPETDGEVAIERFIVQKVLFYKVAAVAQAEHEIPYPVMRKRLHYVPKDRPLANRNQWLGAKLSLLAQSRPKASTENDSLHGMTTFMPVAET
jgi:hypothetical protein